MMKIKIEKEMRLDELIKWARENPELSQGKNFFAKSHEIEDVCFTNGTNKLFTTVSAPVDIPYVVEVEEEVTEETKFDRLFELYEVPRGDCNSISYANTSIKERLNDRYLIPKAYYILNDDLTMTLIWKDGELVV